MSARPFLQPRPVPRITSMLVALALLGAGWRVFLYLMALPVWGDEAFVGVNFAYNGYAEMIQPLIYGQICPLLFMWAELAVSRLVLWLTDSRTAALSEWSLRLLPSIAGLLGLGLFVHFARRTLPSTAAMLAVGIFACSYFITRHTAEIKPYSGDLLISLLITWLTWRVMGDPRSWTRWVPLILVAGVAAWASYPSMFVGGAAGIALTITLVRERFRPQALLGWATFGVVLCGNALWMYLVYAKPHAEAAARVFELDTWSSGFPPVDSPLLWPKWFFVSHTGNLFAYPQGGRAPGSIATFLLFLVGVWRLWKKDRHLSILLLAPFALNMIAAAIEAYPYGVSARINQHLAPAICLLAGLGLSVILRRFLSGMALRRGLLIAAIFFSLIPIGDTVQVILEPYKDDDVKLRREAVEELVERSSPNDRWVVFNAAREPVPHAPWLGDWAGVGAQFLFDVLRLAPVEVQWSPPPEAVSIPEDGSVWFLVYYAIRYDKKQKVVFPDNQLDAYVDVLTGNLGEPVKEIFDIRNKPGKQESLLVYRFGGTTKPPQQPGG